MTEIKAILFDLDGTLIDTEKYYQRVWPQALAHFGYNLSAEQGLQLRSLGRPFAPAKFREWFGEDFDYDKMRAYRKVIFEEVIAKEGISLKPGAEDILKWLKEKGILISTATATDEERTTRYLKKVGLLEYFDRICCATQVKEGKPSPDIYIYAAEQIGIPRENCLAVEDAPNGVRSAHGAGIRTIYIPDLRDDSAELEGLFYKKVNSLAELKKLMEEEKL